MPAKNESTKLSKARKAMLSPLVSKSKKPWRAQAKAKKSIVRYLQLDDKTLTRVQASRGFRPEVVAQLLATQRIAKSSFRFPSNATNHGFSSGYHEAFVVTDMTDKLSNRTQSGTGISAMPVITDGYWKKHSGRTFPERNLSPILQAGDGARTDTARTILSGPNGAVAGHAGSGVSTTGQPDAHDLLRDHSMRVLSDPHMTPAAAGVLAAATTVFSMAPGVLASQAHGAGNLKDTAAKGTWEDDRNEAKERLAVAHNSLSSPERAMVRKHMTPLVIAIGGNRMLDPVQPSSPRRVRHSATGGAISGGGYDVSSPITGSPSKGLPAATDPRQIAQYVSEPFRVERR
jgi:hypothetical protein